MINPLDKAVDKALKNPAVSSNSTYQTQENLILYSVDSAEIHGLRWHTVAEADAYTNKQTILCAVQTTLELFLVELISEVHSNNINFSVLNELPFTVHLWIKPPYFAG